MLRIWGIDKSRGLLGKNSFSERTMEECIFHIHLMDGPILRDCEAEDRADSCRFDHWTKCFTIINTGLLGTAMDYPSGFVSCE